MCLTGGTYIFVSIGTVRVQDHGAVLQMASKFLCDTYTANKCRTQYISCNISSYLFR